MGDHEPNGAIRVQQIAAARHFNIESAGGLRLWAFAKCVLENGRVGKLVPFSFFPDNPGIYRRCGDKLEYVPYHEYWVNICNNYRHRGETNPRQIFVKFDSDFLPHALAYLIADFRTQGMEIGGVWYPYPSVRLMLGDIENLERKCFVDVVDKSRFKWEDVYPKGDPNFSSVDTIYEDLTEEPPAAGEVDEELYELFEDNLLRNLDGQYNCRVNHDKSTKIGAATLSDLFFTLRFRSKGRGSRDWSRVYERKLLLATGVLPKVGVVTSNGKMRRIFPMSLGLSAAQALLLGDAYKHLHLPDATIIKGTRFPGHEFTYDVASCDRVLYDYVRRFCRDRPNLSEILLPPVATSKGVRYVKQFQSGLYCTSLVVHCFAGAILRQVGKHGFVQGDGIMCSEPIVHPLLRRCEPYTINGFCYANPSRPVYVNGREKLTSPRVTQTRPDGRKWDIRRLIYIKCLNADPNTLPPARNPADDEMSVREVVVMAHEMGLCKRLLRYHGVTYDDHRTGWDSAPTKTECPEMEIPLRSPNEVVAAAKSELH